MTRDVNEVIVQFFDKVEADSDFFAYYGVSETEALQLATERARSYLREAVAYLHREIELDFDLRLVRENDQYVFAEEITDDEVDLLSEIMHLRHLERGYAKLTPKINVLSSTDLKVLHSPANERASYVSMMDQARNHVLALVSKYIAVDRITGKRKLMSAYGTFEEEY